MKTNKSADIRKALLQKCSPLGIPVSGIFELTPRCNLKCKMCYIRLTEKQISSISPELTAEEWIEIGKICVDAGMVFLLLTGGEPTIRKDFATIYEALAKMGLSITINTNGTHITDEIKTIWHKYPPSQVNVTIYGASRDDYNELCGNPDAFDKVVDNLNWLKSENILIHLNTTIVPSNYHNWTKIEEFAKSNDFELRLTSYCFTPARRSTVSDCTDFQRLSAEKAGELMALDILYREGIDAVKLRANNLSTSTLRGCELDNGEPIKCMAGSSQFWLTWNGQITPCGMLNEPSFNIIQDGFEKAWQKLKTACSKITLCPECSNCEHKMSCMNCAAVTFAETGNFDGKPIYMCDYNKAYRETLFKIIEAEDKKFEDS